MHCLRVLVGDVFHFQTVNLCKMRILSSAVLPLGVIALLPATAQAIALSNSTYTNPMLPGWHSDPSCIFVAEKDNSFFCTTSSFLYFPRNADFHTSKDLVNWRLASHVFTRASQVLHRFGNTTIQNAGLWAATIRYHDGKFYAIVSYVATAVTFYSYWVYFHSDRSIR